ncbi:MAG TPA: hypothetical protein ENH59_08245 [Bacteroidetes bacterium]|nr:hypothetical protein [Bacteroidota bacterium]
MKKGISKSGLLILIIALTANTMAGAPAPKQQDFFSNKKQTMKNVLEALEEGRSYDARPCWREYEYGFSHHVFDIPDFNFDFEWDFPEIRINEEFIDDLERKLEIIEKRMNEKLQELEKKIDSINSRFS